MPSYRHECPRCGETFSSSSWKAEHCPACARFLAAQKLADEDEQRAHAHVSARWLGEMGKEERGE